MVPVEACEAVSVHMGERRSGHGMLGVTLHHPFLATVPVRRLCVYAVSPQGTYVLGLGHYTNQSTSLSASPNAPRSEVFCRAMVQDVRGGGLSVLVCE